MRMHGHAAHDDMRYVPPELLAEWAGRDPIERQGRRVDELGVDVAALRAEVDEEVAAATQAALAAPLPDPTDATLGVFAEGEVEPLGDGRAPWSGFVDIVAEAPV
jgi:TPP-dependent pyruvate/acetoin dehydrogenase alpha subunit